MCEECFFGSRVFFGVIFCIKSDGIMKMIFIKILCNSVCMKGRYVDLNFKMCEWCL